MPNFQQVIVMGHMGRDAEIRYTGTGKAVCNFSVAVSEKHGDEKHTEWFNCTAWEKTAELITRSFKKGDPAGFVGKLRTREYDDKDGNKKKATDLVVDRVIFLGGKREDAAKSKESGEPEMPF